MDDFENYKTVNKSVKILMGKPEFIEKQAAEFEKAHTVMDIKQKCPTIMFIFYLIEVDPEEILTKQINLFER